MNIHRVIAIGVALLVSGAQAVRGQGTPSPSSRAFTVVLVTQATTPLLEIDAAGNATATLMRAESVAESERLVRNALLVWMASRDIRAHLKAPNARAVMRVELRSVTSKQDDARLRAPVAVALQALAAARRAPERNCGHFGVGRCSTTYP